VHAAFADTGYWIALLLERDELHDKAVELDSLLEIVQLYTSYEVLLELLNYFAEPGPLLRELAGETVQAILDDPDIIVIMASTELFERAFDLYCSRNDKGYSLTDCVSMTIMKDHYLTDVLSHDNHFQQAGFMTLL
jgi:predicted nucleic acid-binding protein